MPPERLNTLATLEAINAELIREGLSQNERAAKRNEIAVYQMQILTNLPTLKGLPDKKGEGRDTPRSRRFMQVILLCYFRKLAYHFGK